MGLAPLPYAIRSTDAVFDLQKNLCMQTNIHRTQIISAEDSHTMHLMQAILFSGKFYANEWSMLK